MFNSLGMMAGIPFKFGKVWKAWKRGRETNNLYNSKFKKEDFLNMEIEELRAELNLDEKGKFKGGLVRFTCFGLFLIFAGAISLTALLALPVILILSLMFRFKKTWATH